VRPARRARSLYTRLATGFAVLTLVGFAAADICSYLVLAHQLRARTDAAISYTLGLRVQEELNTGTFKLGVRSAAALFAPDGTFLQQTTGPLLPDTRLPLTPARLVADARAAKPVPLEPGHLRVAVDRLPDGRYMAVAESTTADDQLLHSLLLIELFISTPLVLAVVAGAVLFSRHALAPLHAVTHTAVRIMRGHHDVTARVPPDHSSRQGECITDAFNEMLDRVETELGRRQRAEAELRDFVAAAGHELRTPLTTITGYAQLARFGALDDPVDLDQAMERVQHEASRMTELVDELLLLARLDQGRPLERVPVDLAALCTEVVTDARVRHPDRDMRWTEPPGDHTVTGDRHRLRQVLINLLCNVAYHTPPGTGVDLRLTREDGWEVLDVVDEGPGIPADLRGRVFERFFQGPRGVQADRPGSGLGLSIVAAIVAAHGGSVTVEPSDRGAWFRVRVPAAPAPRKEQVLVRAASPSAARR
jgi:two-component system OmpR family sensor kinase